MKRGTHISYHASWHHQSSDHMESPEKQGHQSNIMQCNTPAQIFTMFSFIYMTTLCVDSIEWCILKDCTILKGVSNIWSILFENMFEMFYKKMKSIRL